MISASDNMGTITNKQSDGLDGYFNKLPRTFSGVLATEILYPFICYVIAHFLLKQVK